ncbi:MAG: helix-turn-helix domain-containing protein [Balneolaceae bacterium]|nr:MAG: helix-turn-helix domain-containing protein [Balneolaceae bacterium]
MIKALNPAELLKEARKRAGLTQRELAERAGRAQPAIAKIESGKTDPSTSTLNALIEAAGFELHAELTVRPVSDSHMLGDVSRILGLTPEERLLELANVDRFVNGAKRVS